jgi:hypothetical protein
MSFDNQSRELCGLQVDGCGLRGYYRLHVAAGAVKSPGSVERIQNDLRKRGVGGNDILTQVQPSWSTRAF